MLHGQQKGLTNIWITYDIMELPGKPAIEGKYTIENCKELCRKFFRIVLFCFIGQFLRFSGRSCVQSDIVSVQLKLENVRKNSGMALKAIGLH